MELKLAKKSYMIDFSRIEEGYLYSEMSCFADSVNQAKTILLKQCKYENIYLRSSKSEVVYTNIPVIRNQYGDAYFFEDKELTKFNIDKIFLKRKRNIILDKILEDSSITHCYIKKGGYYKPGACGYTDFRHRAGIFPKSEAISNARSTQELYIIPIDNDEHNKMITDEIVDLQSRLLCV